MSQVNLNGAAANAVLPLSPSVAGTTAGGISSTAGVSVRGAIARAAAATGVDFSYLLAQARLESSLDPQARARTSSAAGLYQFTKGTWGTMLARHGATLGAVAGTQTGPAGSVAGLPSATLPTSRAQLMAMRYDPNAAAMMAAELAGDNSTALTGTLGRAPTSSELYLAHFLGAGGATRFLAALATDPGQSAAALLPRAASANHAIFFDAGGAPRSLGNVMALTQTRMDTAMQDVGGPGSGLSPLSGNADDLGATQTASWPLDQQFVQAQAAIGGAEARTGVAGAGTGDFAPAGAEPVTSDRSDAGTFQNDAGTVTSPSMADTLRNTFALAEDGAGSGNAPDFVRSAYSRMQALGL